MARVTCLALLVVALCLVLSAEARRVARHTSPLSKAKFDASRHLDSRVPPFTTHWFTQTLDHFSFANTQTFQQRYLVVGTSHSLQAQNRKSSTFPPDHIASVFLTSYPLLDLHFRSVLQAWTSHPFLHWK
jgi:hypothetical protein